MSFDIIIPSHDRIENLRQVLSVISSQKKYFNQLFIIVEPKSDYKDKVKNLLDEIFLSEAQVIVNSCPLGTDASILRCFEYGKSNWVFLAGDSKLLNNNFAKKINAEIKNSSHKAVNFSWDSKLDEKKIVTSVEELVKSQLTLGDFILASNFVYHREIIDLYLKYAYRTCSSRIGHVAIPLMHLNNSGSILLSNVKIIDEFILKPKNYDPGLAWIECLSCFNLLVLLPLKNKEIRLLSQMILRNESLSDRLRFLKYFFVKTIREKRNINKELLLLLHLRYVLKFVFLDKIILNILLKLEFLIRWLR